MQSFSYASARLPDFFFSENLNPLVPARDRGPLDTRAKDLCIARDTSDAPIPTPTLKRDPLTSLPGGHQLLVPTGLYG
jgi:hypothetical protein